MASPNSSFYKIRNTRKGLTECFLIRQTETGCTFSRESRFSTPKHYKNKQVTYLLPVGFFQLGRKLENPNRQQIRICVCVCVCVCVFMFEA